MLLALAVPLVCPAEDLGFSTVTIPAVTDVAVTVPYNNGNKVEFTIDAGGINIGAKTVKPTVALTNGLYSGGRYYVRFTSGGADGLWTTITSNDAVQFTLEETSALALAAAGNTFRVYRHWTVEQVFPTDQLGVSYVDGTQLLFYSNTTNGYNKSAVKIVEYVTFPSAGWDDPPYVIKPDTMFKIRNNSASALTYSPVGLIPDHTISYLIPSGVNKDTFLGAGHPVTTTLGLTNFGDPVNGDGRTILIYNPAALTGLNRSADRVGQYVTFPSPEWDLGHAEAIAGCTGYIFRQHVGDPGGVIRTTQP
jgi:uncharacterized protein (TIGR02597 family)